MTFPQRAYDIVVQLWTRFPDLAHGTDDQRRTLTRIMAEQLAFELGTRWGTKAQSLLHPPAKDALAYRLTADDEPPMDIWDWQHGATREVQVRAGMPPTHPHVTDQHFIAVEPRDHLGVVPPLPPGPLPMPDLDARVRDLEALVDGLQEQLGDQQELIGALLARPYPYPAYVGQVWWRTVRVTPEP